MRGFCWRTASQNRLEKNEVSDNRYGCKLVASRENRILGNTFLQNRFEAINLQESDANLIEGNYASGSDGALVLDRSRDNIVRKNDFAGNEKGIYLSYLGTGNDVQSKGKGVVISYNSMPSSEAVSTNNSIYLNNLSNKKNARDDSLNYWDNGKVGNNYSDFNDPAEGCKGIKICEMEKSITGGPSVDRYPQASPVPVLGRSTGPGGAALQLSGKSYLPGGRMNLNFTAPAGAEVWVGRAAASGQEDRQDDLYLGQNISGDVWLTAPQEEGSYQLAHARSERHKGSVPALQCDCASAFLRAPRRFTPARRSSSPSGGLSAGRMTGSACTGRAPRMPPARQSAGQPGERGNATFSVS